MKGFERSHVLRATLEYIENCFRKLLAAIKLYVIIYGWCQERFIFKCRQEDISLEISLC